jgi:hypothetical protein
MCSLWIILCTHRKTKGNEREKQFNLYANFSTGCIWCQFSQRIYEKWTVEYEHRQFHTSAQSTHVSLRRSSQGIQFYTNSNVITNAIRDASILSFSLLRSHIASHFRILKQIEKCSCSREIRICSKINSFRNWERRIGWLEASKHPASVEQWTPGHG